MTITNVIDRLHYQRGGPGSGAGLTSRAGRDIAGLLGQTRRHARRVMSELLKQGVPTSAAPATLLLLAFRRPLSRAEGRDFPDEPSKSE